jgi:hypothetical protein
MEVHGSMLRDRLLFDSTCFHHSMSRRTSLGMKRVANRWLLNDVMYRVSAGRNDLLSVKTKVMCCKVPRSFLDASSVDFGEAKNRVTRLVYFMRFRYGSATDHTVTSQSNPTYLNKNANMPPLTATSCHGTPSGRVIAMIMSRLYE